YGRNATEITAYINMDTTKAARVTDDLHLQSLPRTQEKMVEQLRASLEAAHPGTTVTASGNELRIHDPSRTPPETTVKVMLDEGARNTGKRVNEAIQVTTEGVLITNHGDDAKAKKFMTWEEVGAGMPEAKEMAKKAG